MKQQMNVTVRAGGYLMTVTLAVECEDRTLYLPEVLEAAYKGATELMGKAWYTEVLHTTGPVEVPEEAPCATKSPE
jgi:hypothetical protein